MKMEYFSDTDSLYIDLSNKASVDTIEIDHGINIDIDREGHIVGIDIDLAAKLFDLTKLDFKGLPIEVAQ